MIAGLQEQFRSRDLDKNGTADFWRGEIAGLLRATEMEGHLINARVEGMEEPKPARFRVRAIRFSDEAVPDRRRFAAVCFPVEYAPGIRSHYVVREDGGIWKKDLGHANGVDVYPADPAAEGWKRVE